MATQAQIEANRKNAQKSTGPKSKQGKDTVSQNAVKHGLCANKHVIRSESQEEFDEFRQNMIADLEPVGAMEKMLADRIVSLSWRLKRAEQFQNLAIESLIEFNLNDGWYRGASARREADKGNLELIIGFAINRDFEEGRTLDLLLMYERRIESSLYKASAELRKMQRIRRKEDKRETVSRASCPRLHEQEAEAAESMDMKKAEDRKIRSEEDKRGEKEFDLENQSQFDSAAFGGLRSAMDIASLESCAEKQSQIDMMDETGRGIESSGEGHPHPDKLHRDEDATREGKKADELVEEEDKKIGEIESDFENQSQFDSAAFGVRRSANDNRGMGEAAAHKQDSGEGHPHPDKLHRDEDATREGKKEEDRNIRGFDEEKGEIELAKQSQFIGFNNGDE